MNAATTGRPPQLVAASERPLRLAGAPATIAARVPVSGRTVLRSALDGEISARGRRPRVYLNVEDLRADKNQGAVYGVYLGLPAPWDEKIRNRHHVGNVTVFGVEAASAKDAAHDHVPGMRHTFDVTRRIRTLWRSRRLDDLERIPVTFLLELPIPPPDYQGDDAQRILQRMVDDAAATPITVGRVSLFVG
jgi:hypothetical protein